MDVIYVGAVNWHEIGQRPQAIASGLARTHRVLYVNPAFYSLPRYVHDRWVRRGSHRRRGLRKLSSNLWILSPPPMLPRARTSSLLSGFNLYNAARMIAKAREELEFEKTVLWVAEGWAAQLANWVPHDLLVYDCVDNVPAFHRGYASRVVRKLENRLIARSDVVLCTSEGLLAKCQKLNGNCFLVRNGIWSERYMNRNLNEPSEMAAISRPILGFVGYLGSWVDVDLLEELARKFAECSVVLVGPVRARHAGLSRLSNVFLLGMKPHEDVPAYINTFDVCLIPFRRDALTADVNPIKFYEYCALGKPVVSSEMPELLRYREMCYLAKNREEFLSCVSKALAENASPATARELARRRQAIGIENSWEHRISEINAILARHWPREASLLTAR
jgi:glycosyltransferase involved in cell wall biosynthesis